MSQWNHPHTRLVPLFLWGGFLVSYDKFQAMKCQKLEEKVSLNCFELSAKLCWPFPSSCFRTASWRWILHSKKKLRPFCTVRKRRLLIGTADAKVRKQIDWILSARKYLEVLKFLKRTSFPAHALRSASVMSNKQSNYKVCHSAAIRSTGATLLQRGNGNRPTSDWFFFSLRFLEKFISTSSTRKKVILCALSDGFRN